MAVHSPRIQVAGAKPGKRADGLPLAIYISTTLVLSVIALGFWASGFTERNNDWLRFIFFDPAPVGTDLTGYERFLAWPSKGAELLNPADVKSTFNYCPFAFFVVLFFLRLFPDPVSALIVTTAVAVLAAAVFFARSLRGNRLALAAVVTAFCTSYPYLYLFDRGNIEGLVWIAGTYGIWSFLRRNYWAAALGIGLAVSIKPFPAMLILLLVMAKRYVEAAAGLALAALINVISLFAIGPDPASAYEGVKRGFELVVQRYVLFYSPADLATDHTLYSVLKMLVRLSYGWSNTGKLVEHVQAAYPYYQVFAGIVFVCSTIVLWRRPLLNRIFGLCVLMVLISPLNFDYTLIGMYVPWAALVYALASRRFESPRRLAVWLLILLAILFTSQYYIFFGENTSFSGQIKALALAGILLISLLYPLRTRERSDEYDGISSGGGATLRYN